MIMRQEVACGRRTDKDREFRKSRTRRTRRRFRALNLQKMTIQPSHFPCFISSVAHLLIDLFHSYLSDLIRVLFHSAQGLLNEITDNRVYLLFRVNMATVKKVSRERQKTCSQNLQQNKLRALLSFLQSIIVLR